MTLQPVRWVITEPWGRLGFRVFRGAVFVHCDITRWDRTIRRECDARWAEFKTILRRTGVTRIYSAVPESDAKVRKWQKLFGQQLSELRSGTAIYTQEL